VTERSVDKIERILAETEDADDLLRQTMTALVEDPEIVWAGIRFLEDGELVLGPEGGSPDDTRRTHVPITFHGAVVGELQTDGNPERAQLERVAALIAPHVLIGWDTKGETWEP
jgi:putative methionine-R-sulfoxide reductase with GAF domain